MSTTLLCEFAGLATALLWGLAAMCWAVLGRRGIHPTTAATMRLVFATAALVALHAVLYGTPWPSQLSWTACWVLALSGAAGPGIGDVFYFHGIQRIGPRLTMTVTALTPVASALLARLSPMHERMTWLEVGGMLLAVAGVAWVVAEKSGRDAWPSTPAAFRQGVICCILSVLFQAGSNVLGRYGLVAAGAPVAPFSAALVRVAAGCACSWALVMTQGGVRGVAAPFRNPVNLGWILLGVATGPVIGIGLSMIALGGTSTGVASTLIALSPLFLIPLSWAAYGERPTVGRVVATIVALGGVACMMFGHA
jgi:drug/metabolite transporter (DMT)-like permease